MSNEASLSKIAAILASFALFAPIAALVLAQAARIVA